MVWLDTRETKCGNIAFIKDLGSGVEICTKIT